MIPCYVIKTTRQSQATADNVCIIACSTGKAQLEISDRINNLQQTAPTGVLRENIMERTADTVENCVTDLEEKSCEKQTACSEAVLYNLFSALKYRVVVDRYGTRRYYNDAGQLHREDGPAIVYADGSTLWYQNGLRHRDTGPAVIRSNGHNEWWINGAEYTQSEYQAHLKALGHT